MHTIKETYTNKIIINKSVFITTAFSVSTTEDVLLKLSETKKKYYDARHNCYAYILGKNQNIQKASDDGEPSQTAGFPMLNVLKKNNMTNILVITTRYFGGIKLGAGGLIRAYGRSVSDVLDKSETYHLEVLRKINLELSYSEYNTFLSNNYSLRVLDLAFTEKVTLTLGVEKDSLESFTSELDNLLLGKENYTLKEEFEVLIKDKAK